MSWKDIFPKENRYYETENGILYNADCLDLIKSFPDVSVDLIVTDPPYNIGDTNKLCKQGNTIKSNKEMWGHFEPVDETEWMKFLDDLFVHFYRVCKGSLFIFYNRLEITRIKDMLKSKGFQPKNLLAIIKLNPLPHFRKNGFRSDFELCLYCQKEKGKDTFNFLSQEEMKSVDYYTIGRKETDHETEKPINAILKYISVASNKGHLVFDPFIGSGTTAAACERAGRYWIGIEKEKRYCEMAKKRIANENSQGYLF